MGKEEEEERKDEREASSFHPTLKFPFLPLPSGGSSTPSPDHPSPPLQTSVSVPFKWEEQPGKPRPCTDIIPLPAPVPPARIVLEPPPCWNSKMTKMPSPTAVLDGPYPLARPKFSSFRFVRRRDESFDSTSAGSPYSSLDLHHHHQQHDALLGSTNKAGGGQQKGKLSLFGLRFKIGKKDAADEGSFGLSSPSSASEGRMRRNGSFSTLSQSQPTSPRICATIYQRFKHAVPWKSTRKSRKDGGGAI